MVTAPTVLRVVRAHPTSRARRAPAAEVRRSSPARKTGRSCAPSRWHVVLIALGLLLAQGPTLLHLLLVPHTACEHGELVERAPESLGAQPPAEARHPDQQQIERAHQDGGGHEHCDVLAVRHRVPEVGASVAAASIVWVTPIEAGVERTETRPVPLLSLAPKGSPPAA